MSQMLYQAPPEISRYRTPAFVVGGLGLLACLAGAFIKPAQFFHSYLFGYMFWIGIALGCMGLTMVQYLSGGAWGLVIRRLLESGARTLPLMAVLFIPMLFGVRVLYRWANRAEVERSEALQHKHLYLNLPFFFVRVAIYFAVWCGISYLLNKWSRLQDETADPRYDSRLQAISGPGIVVYALTLTFAVVDWIMSLEPEWFSTIFGLLFVAGQALSAMAFTIAVTVILARREPMSHIIQKAHLHDLGKLLFAFVMLWAYLSFSQFLIVWSANLPEEIPWYLRRFHGGWGAVGMLIVVCHFALPFLLLLSRDLKRNGGRIIYIAAFIVMMRAVDLFWIIAPGVRGDSFLLHWMDVAAIVGLGGIWLATYLTQLGRRPLLPVNDPHLQEALQNGNHH